MFALASRRATAVFAAPRRLGRGAERFRVRFAALSSDDGSAPSSDAALAAPEVYDDLDLNDPIPVIALLNRQLAGEKLDPVEVFEVMEPIPSVVIGDVEACEAKLRGYQSIGCDRLMCLMQMGHVSQESVLRSIQLTGEHLIPRLS